MQKQQFLTRNCTTVSTLRPCTMEIRGLFWCTILALLCMQSVRMAHGQSVCPDQYVYSQQPPEDVVCNPYRGRTLRMECSVMGPNVGEIRWYFSTTSSTFDENTTLLTSSTKYTLAPVTITNGAGVRLTVHNLTEEEDAGYYWCQAYVSGRSQILSESAVFILRDQSYYIDFTCGGVILRNSNTKCATLMEVPTESSTDLVATSYSTGNPTSTIDVQPSMSPVPSSLSITLPSIVATTTQLQSSDASSSTLSPVPTLMVTITTDSTSTNFNTASTPTEQSTAVTFPRNPSQLSEIILYAVLGLIGFVILICISLAVVILILCHKRHQRIGLEAADTKHPKSLAAPNDYVDVSSVKDGTISDSYRVNTSTSLPEETSPAHHNTSRSSSTSVAENSPSVHHT